MVTETLSLDYYSHLLQSLENNIKLCNVLFACINGDKQNNNK